ncbi:MAG: hypothetical protein JW740_00760 [Candidatus Zambryskibacteria bacterium]|nr:hypothetical protein [Candidatus Zambryskibacteria bacterium]
MKKKVVVNDRMQRGYKYEITEPAGKNFDPAFKPDLSPKEMLQLGVFGGVYMRDCTREFPKLWFARSKFAPPKIKEHLAGLNYFKVNASQSLSIWRKKGWIYREDPRGWFQWYCRYYMGRRLPEEDQRQIKRWKAIRRHIAQIKKHCPSTSLRTSRNQKWCRPTQRQALLHWAYDSRKM